MAEAAFEIGGMSCQHCVGRVKKALDALDGVTTAEVSVGRAQVNFNENKLKRGDIETAITKAGYKITG